MSVALWLQSTAILIGAIVVLSCMSRRSSGERHALLLAVFFLLLVLPLGRFLPAAMAIPSLALPIAVTATGQAVAPSAVISWSTLWLVGFVLAFCRILFSAVWTFTVLRSASQAETHDSYPVVYTTLIGGPAAWGLGRKRVLMPQCATDWDEERRSVVLRHEAAHLRRNDCWALLLSEVECAFYWCNPLTWLLAARLRREQEHAADDEVLNSGVEPIGYAAHLVALAKSARAPILAAGAVTRSHLSARIEAILDTRRSRTMPNRTAILTIVTALLALTFPLVSMQAQRKVEKILDGQVSAPRPIEKYEPQYTEAAKEAKIEGSVTLEVVIEANGRIYEAAVVRGLDPGLDANAVEAVKTWRFEPARKAGEPVAVAAKIEVNFRLL